MSISAIPRKTVVVDSSAPASPFEGQLWRDTSTNTLKQWDGSSWDKVQKSDVDIGLGWVKEGGKTVSGVSSVSYSPSTKYDQYLIVAEFSDQSNNAGDFRFRVNGDSGQNYDMMRTDGSLATGGSVFNGAPNYSNGDDTVRAVFIVDGRWNTAFKFFQMPLSTNASINNLHGNNKNVSSPLGSIEWFGNNSTSFYANIEVFGRDLP